MPAVTLAGALALAGCGGGSGTPTMTDGNGDNNGDDDKVTLTDEICGEGRMVNAAGDACVADPDYVSERENTANASALYDRIVKSIATGTTATGNVPNPLGATASAVVGLNTAKAEHKAIETIREEGETWLVAIASGGDIDARIGDELVSGTNAGYYPIDAGPDSGQHTVKASAFTQRVGLKHKTGASFSGEYMGVSGTFKCTGANGCTSSPASGENVFTLSTDTTSKWHFKPNDRMAKLQGDRLAEWGWWITNVGKEAEAVNIVYRNFGEEEAVAAPDQAGIDISTLPNAGKATYTGKAHGQYAVVDGADSESGAFEATAALEASFAAQATKLSGRIHTFDVNSDWEITLKENPSNPTSSDQFAFKGATVWKTGDEDGLGEGNWRAKLFGGGNDTEPERAVGGFTAVDAGARMVGAFGGEPPKQE